MEDTQASPTNIIALLGGILDSSDVLWGQVEGDPRREGNTGEKNAQGEPTSRQAILVLVQNGLNKVCKENKFLDEIKIKYKSRHDDGE